MQTIKIINTSVLPIPWDYLVTNKTKQVVAIIYTENFIKENDNKDIEGRKIKYGIHKGRKGVYNVVVSAKEINSCVIGRALEDLEKKTSRKYVYVGRRTYDDDIYDFAEKLILESEKKFKTKKGHYDYNRAVKPLDKADVIGGWIGEFLHWAVTDKDARVLESLWRTVRYEIAELLKGEKK